MERESVLTDEKTQDHQHTNFPQPDLYIQSNLNQNFSKLFCGYWQTDFKVYMGRQKTQNFHLNVEKEKQSWRTDKTQL